MKRKGPGRHAKRKEDCWVGILNNPKEGGESPLTWKGGESARKWSARWGKKHKGDWDSQVRKRKARNNSIRCGSKGIGWNVDHPKG